MNIEELKNIVESGNLPETFTIVKFSDTDFIINQYISFVQGKNTYQFNYIESLYDLASDSFSLFDSDIPTYNIYRCELFDFTDESIKTLKNTLVICKNIDKKSKDIFKDFIIEIPKLENWQIEDYAYSRAEGADSSKIKRLVEICKYNIYRLDSELNKIALFPKEKRKFILESFFEDNVFNDLNDYSIFNFSNCLIQRNAQELFKYYLDINNIDVEPIGLQILMCNNFKKIIDVQLSQNATAESLNLKPNQYWAIKKNSCNYYTREELMNIYSELTDLDRKIKIGEFPVEHLVDYIICKVFSC